MHPWHSVEIGKDVPRLVTAVIEVPKGSKIKYELDKKSGKDLPPHRMTEVKRFFEDYKQLERKSVVVEDFLDRADALKVIEEAIALYAKEKSKLLNETTR